MIWNTDKPKQPGWYIWRRSHALAEIERQNVENLKLSDEEHEKDLAEKDRELQQIREHEFQNGYRESESIWEEKYQQLMRKAFRFAVALVGNIANKDEIEKEAIKFLDSPEAEAWKERS